MFTGIIRAVGEVMASQKRSGDLRIEIGAHRLGLEQTATGDSIAVNGVCLTVVELTEKSFLADVSAETLACSTLGRLHAGSKVNLEKALRVGDALGGHLVSGHVDAIGRVRRRSEKARSVIIEIELPVELAKFIAVKGSVTIDGTSLTVNRVANNRFDVNIVPHTLEQTIIGSYRCGQEVNIEVDLLARYLERLMTARDDTF